MAWLQLVGRGKPGLVCSRRIVLIYSISICVNLTFFSDCCPNLGGGICQLCSSVQSLLTALLVMQPSSGRVAGRDGDTTWCCGVATTHMGEGCDSRLTTSICCFWAESDDAPSLWAAFSFSWCELLWMICSVLSCYLMSTSLTQAVPAHMVHFQALFHLKYKCYRIFNPKVWYLSLFLNTSRISLGSCLPQLLLIWLEHFQKKCLKHLQIISEDERLTPEVFLCTYC